MSALAANLALNAASLVYDNGFAALHDISAQFKRGSFTALVGPSGCGKSSLLRLLAGLEPASSGSVTGVTQGEIGFVFQDPTLLAWRSVADNITLPLKIEGHKQAEMEARLAEALQLVGLTDFAHALPRQLSGGMKMRVSLARALAKRPPLLLMDEPFAALDELTRFRLDDDLRAIWQKQKCTIVFVTHSVTEAAYLAERALVMQEGRLRDEIVIEQKNRTDGFRNSSAFAEACAALGAALGHEKAAAS